MCRCCGICGAQLDGETGLCPNSDSNLDDDEFELFLEEIKTLDFFEQEEQLELREDYNRNGNSINRKKVIQTSIERKEKARNKPSKESNRFWNNGRKMICSFMTLCIFVVALLTYSVAAKLVHNRTNVDYVEKSANASLYDINRLCIQYVIIGDKSSTDSDNTILLEVEIPDYAKLYKAAWTSAEPNRYIQDVLFHKQYETCKYHIEAKVTFENGIQVIHSDEAIRKLLEQALLAAIQSVVEEQK